VTAEPIYVIDADVLITDKNRYYAFGICPGFWDSLLYHHALGRLHSLDRIRDELLAGREDEDLVQWAKNIVPGSFFVATNEREVVDAYGDVMLWVQRNPQYSDSAKAKFATEADGWLAAYAAAKGEVVITNEQPRPESRNRILLPDVCNHLSVPYDDTFEMLRSVGVQYTFAADR
jgi:hypothetical protein